MTELELAYLTGFFDGEGCVGVYARSSKLVLCISVNGTHQDSIERFKRAFGGRVGPIKSIGNRKPQWVWGITGRKAQAVLAQMLPYMNIKAPQAKLAIAFPYLVDADRPRNHITGGWAADPINFAEKVAIRKQLNILNKRGVA